MVIRRKCVTDGKRDFSTARDTALVLRSTSIPRFQKTVFKIGQVLTVEPGLYYPGIGGVRTEDVVAITKSGIRMLSRFENKLEL